MIRRDLLKSSLATMVGAPALPAALGGFPRLGKTPVHTEAEFRTAFERYIARYTAFFTPYKEPEFYTNEDALVDEDEADIFEDKRGRLCRAWHNAKRRLLEMTMENNGYDPSESCPGVASVSVDLSDVSFVVACDPDFEGHSGGASIVVILPRTLAMFDRLNELPNWEEPPGRLFPPPIDPDDYCLIGDDDDQEAA
jgi:hypothetical protein